MNLDAHIKNVIAAQNDARNDIQNSPAYEYSKELTKGKREISFSPKLKSMLDKAQAILAKELAEPIAKAILEKSHDTNSLLEKIGVAEEKLYYRSMALIDDKPSDEPQRRGSAWVNRRVSRELLLSSIEDLAGAEGRKLSSKVNLAESRIYIKLQGSYLLKIGDRFLGETPYMFTQSADFTEKNYEEMAQKAPHELLGVWLSYGQKDNGKPHYGSDYQLNAVVTQAVREIYKDASIGVNDIAKLVSQGHIKPTPMHQTEFFRKNYAPSTNDRYVNNTRDIMEKLARRDNDIFLELKPKLSQQEILSYILSETPLSKANWLRAMAMYEVHTGDRLSYEDVLKLNPIEKFNIKRTEAYAQKVDTDFNKNNPYPITVKVESVKDHHSRTNQKTVIISINCKSVESEATRDAIRNQIGMLAIPLHSMSPGKITYEMTVKAEDQEKLPKEIVKYLESCMSDITKNMILPGDVVTINSKKAKDLNLKNGDVALVTDIDEGLIKLKGDSAYYPPSLFEIKRKYQPEQNADLSMGR